MDNIKNDIYYATKIRDDFKFILESTEMKSNAEIEKDLVLLDSIMFRLIQISENSQKLTDEFKDTCKEIPWIAIKGLRNRIVHDYGNVDYSIIFEVIKNEIPACINALNKTIK